MKDYNPSFNPFSPENLYSLHTTLVVLLILGILIVCVFLTDKFIIPRLSPENRFVKWWIKHIIDVNPFEK